MYRKLLSLLINNGISRALIKRVKDYVIGHTYLYCFDNLATNNNLDVIRSAGFLRAYDRAIVAAGMDLKIPLRVHQAIWCAEYAQGIEGDFVEIGTGKGFTFSAIMEFLTERSPLQLRKKNVYLFDSFLPTKPDLVTGKQLLKSGASMSAAYSDDVDSVRRNFLEWENVQIIEGELPNSAEHFLKTEPRISFFHVDLNHFKPEISTLEKFWPYLSQGAVVLIDDYANPGRQAQKAAHEAFFSNHGLSILTLASGQGIVIVNNKGLLSK